MAAPPYIPNLIGIDMAVAKQHLDFINLMTYDFHGTWETEVNFMAPWSDPAGGTLDISNTLNHFINVLGWPRSKLNLGLGLYGASWTLSPFAPAAIGAAAAGTGPGQPCTRERGCSRVHDEGVLLVGAAPFFTSRQVVGLSELLVGLSGLAWPAGWRRAGTDMHSCMFPAKC
jgi:hypothetical protein